MVDVVSASLPFLADKPTIKRTLEECKGNIDVAVDKLMGAEENGSLSSAQESSSVEREPDSEDEYPGKDGPNKKRDRRLSSRQKPKETDPSEMRAKFETHNDSHESFKSEASDSSSALSEKKKPNDLAADDRPRPTIRLKFNSQKASSPAPALNGQIQQKQQGPQRQTAREKKDFKKQAQKAARKERQQAAANDDKSESAKANGMKLRSKGMVNTPPIESGFRTLFI